MGRITKLVEEIDKTYWSEPKKAKQRIVELLELEINERVTQANVKLLREFTDGLRLLIRHYKKEISKRNIRQ